MRYVALLRGINVGGKNKVEMAKLVETFNRVGATDVSTYINSGNVIFSDDRSPDDLAEALEDAIEEDFGLRIKVLLCAEESLRAIAAGVPDSWVHDQTMKTNVMFLWDEVDSPRVLNDLGAKEGLDEVEYTPGAVIWRVDAENLTRSGTAKLAGTKVYQSMTVRNINTVRKLVALLDEQR